MVAKMRILYVTVKLPYGAGESFITPEILGLLKFGHEVFIAPRSCSRQLVHDNVGDLLPHTIRTDIVSTLWAFLYFALRQPRKLLTLLSKLFQSPKPHTLLKNAPAFIKGLWLAKVLQEHKIEHLHVHWLSTTATMGWVASELTGTPWSITAHRGDILANNLIALKTRSASFVRYISQSGLALARDRGAYLENAVVIHMGVDLPGMPGSASTLAPKRRADNLRVLCPANLIPVKGHRYLLTALALLKNKGVIPILDLAGSGVLMKELKAEVVRLGLHSQVNFLGHVPHQQLLTNYGDGNVDVVILPSIDLGNGLHEGIPVSLIEAMSYGIPVISTIAGGTPELLKDGAGLLVPPGDPEAIADALDRLLKDGELRYSLGSAGKTRVQEQFSLEATVTKLVGLYQLHSGGAS